ncbi:HK97 family phage prohead protease [Sandaracinobacteroides saxicola]|uniref:HK97 family phage prohead protease n=1 Tax=Sandaracinobacteroides saxicola TaxID=2759707 RepID=A0A7G5IJ36_9SPHN|nr:HK97 family phage prohead protease [Sandaracinobacteroides saxicola]QMW23378.1 HK97 family phage prohead protease [Sandaracinobacteroides saxicola]
MSAVVRIAGYVSRFDSVDRGGDVVRRGAFAEVKAGVPLLWQHDVTRPVGRVESLSEDARGLRMVAAVAADSAGGAEALALVRGGAVTGLSFGYRVKRARGLPGGGRELLKLELIECSIVTLPMQDAARIGAVEGVDGAEVERLA